MSDGVGPNETSGPEILYEKKGPVAVITMNRPSKINAMNGVLYQQFTDALDDYADDDNLRCAILTGAGSNFTSGGDLKWWADIRAEARSRGRPLRYEFDTFRSLARLRKPLIAAIDGWCSDSGFNLLLYSDIRIASGRAKIRLSVGRMGLVAGDNLGGYPHPMLPNLSLGDALYITLTGETLSPTRAREMGLINEVVEPEQLMERAHALAAIIAERPPESMQYHKTVLRMAAETPGSFLGQLQMLAKRASFSAANPIEAKTQEFFDGKMTQENQN